MRRRISEEWICNSYHDPWLGFVRIDQKGEIVVVNMKIRPEIAGGRNGSEKVTEPPDNLGACPWIGRNDKDGLGKYEAFP